MKKSLCILSAALIVASSCSKYEQPVETNEVKMVSATIDAQSTEGGSKTSATKEGDVYKIKWTAGDTLSVFYSDATDMATTGMAKFKTKNTGASAKFEGEIPEGSIIVAAIYPYYRNATISEDKKTVYTNVPTEQTGAFNNVVLAGWPKPEGDEMTIAETYDFKYQFEAVCGIVKFSFDPTKITGGKTITSISLTADQPLCGDAKISYPTEGKPVLTPNPNATGSNVYNTITIEKKDGFTEGDYYFATFPINANGDEGLKIVIRFETSTGDVAYKQATLKAVADKEGSKHILAANIVKNIGTVKVDKYDKITGAFTVAKGKKVYFSPGNLQFQASTSTWRFAPNQWDAQGEIGNSTAPNDTKGNEGTRATQSEWIDLFPLGHTGWADTKRTYFPYSSYAAEDMYCAKIYTTDITGTDRDWGHYCQIINGNVTDPKDTWRLLTSAEWRYLLCLDSGDPGNVDYKNGRWEMVTTDTGSEGSGKGRRLIFMKIGVKTGVFDTQGNEIIRYGVLLFPDGFTWPSAITKPAKKFYSWKGADFYPTERVSGFTPALLYSLTEFAVFEQAGCIFLPATGKRGPAGGSSPITINEFNSGAYYWSTGSTAESHFAVYIRSLALEAASFTQARAVRLVKNGEGW